MSESFLVVGWESCPYAQKAIEDLKLNGKRYEFLDERKYGPVLLSDIPNWSGNGGAGWRSPHIFKMTSNGDVTGMDYIGGSSDLERYFIKQNQSEKLKRCRRFLGRVICE